MDDLPQDAILDIMGRLGDADPAAAAITSRRMEASARFVMRQRASAVYEATRARALAMMEEIGAALQKMQEWISTNGQRGQRLVYEHGELRGCMHAVACASLVVVAGTDPTDITLRQARTWERVISNLASYRYNSLLLALETSEVDFGLELATPGS